MSVPQRMRKPPGGQFGKWLDAMLRSRRWTQADLAKALGVDGSMVSKWVRGARVPDVPHCEAVARAFGLAPWEVLGMTGRVRPEVLVPAGDPIRSRAHALIDAMDPAVVDTLIPLLRHLATDPDQHRAAS